MVLRTGARDALLLWSLVLGAIAIGVSFRIAAMTRWIAGARADLPAMPAAIVRAGA